MVRLRGSFPGNLHAKGNDHQREDEANEDVLAPFAGHKQTPGSKAEDEEDQRDADEPWGIGQDQLVRSVTRDFHGGTLALKAMSVVA